MSNKVLHLTIARKLLEQRKKLGLSQAVAAMKAEMDPTHYRNIELGKRNPTVSTLLKMLVALEMELVLKPRKKR